MYPFFRLFKELYLHRNAEPLPLTGIHVSRHVCWPWDLDMWMELNNGRTLTLLDLGRLPLAQRVGLIGVLRRERWSLTMAGVSVRYRRRVRMFDAFEIRSRCVGWDEKFLYIEQGMWRNGDCANHALYRSAVTDRNGIVPTVRLMAAMGREIAPPPLPDWVQAWIAAEAERPWPPMTD
ncbi:thioesterase family protein [Rhodovulum kholense]|uniref:Acyl-CoA thioesterase FadM n=1 Tax=Rhodovulum kholense TaxID=453584 RepID=A0A8E3APD4_9RHOB|nr:thioesterase family protein [Rhodovulum kholense]PTW44840.1 acyl-CoA thioesterase FadM [Rhodovulum kholense]